MGENSATDKRVDQARAFREAARELECDESEDRFNTVLRQVAKHKPKPEEAKAEKDKPGQ